MVHLQNVPKQNLQTLHNYKCVCVIGSTPGDTPMRRCTFFKKLLVLRKVLDTVVVFGGGGGGGGGGVCAKGLKLLRVQGS